MFNRLQAVVFVALIALLIFQWGRALELKDSLRESSEALVRAESEIQAAKLLIEDQNTAIANLVHTAQLKNIESNAKAAAIQKDLPAVIRRDHASPATANDMNAWLEELFL